MKVSLLLIAVLTAFVASADGATPDSWTAEPPAGLSFRKNLEIPPTDIFEVVASMRANAETALQQTPLLPLSDAQARRFTGAYYACPKGKRPFLVRALFGLSDHGRFWVYRMKDDIWVLHESLGTELTSKRTALVVNLDFAPAHAYVSNSIVR